MLCLLLFACNSACGNRGYSNIPSSWPHLTEQISRNLDSTVAIGAPRNIRHLLEEQPVPGQAFVPRCTGVWLNERLILTAGHCVNRYRMIQGIMLTPQGIRFVPRPISDYGPNPLGDRVPYFSYRDHLRSENIERTGQVVKFSRQLDLALIRVESLSPHSWPQMRLTDLSVGETVDHVGNPAEQLFSYTTGIVSRPILRDGPQLLVHTTAPGFNGSSGGGIFDSEGRLIGLQVQHVARQSFLMLGVHFRQLREFILSSGTR